MKIFITFAFLCVLQSLAGQVVLDEKHEKHVNNAVQQNQHHNSDQPGHEINSQLSQHVSTEQHVVLPSQQHVVQHVTEPSTTATIVDSKVTVAIPAKVQQIVTQVSQHIPQVINHHLANKQRTVRAVKNPEDWRELQVNAVDQPGKCAYLCPENDATVCGYNGNCYWHFVSQCDLSTYNCLNTKKPFIVVDFAKCQDIGAAKCYRGDM